MSNWISIKEELPPIDECVLWYYPNGAMAVFEIDKDASWEFIEKIESHGFPPTHWRYLPDPPEDN